MDKKVGSTENSREEINNTLEYFEVYQGRKKSIIPANMETTLDLQEVIGLPPSCNITEQEILNTMPIIEIEPCTSKFVLGSEVYELVPAWNEYVNFLKNLGYRTPNQQYIKFAFIADSFPTDTFSNSYGESFLNRLSNVASEGAGDLAQFFGARNAIEAGAKSFGALERVGGKLGGAIGGALGAVGEMGREAAQSSQRFLRQASRAGGAGGALAGMTRTVSAMLAGQRVDFPQVWKSSGFSPSYTMTIRLYNPNPSDPESTRKFIAGPLSAILLLGVPQSDTGDTYSWPYLHKIRCKGVFELNTAFISNIAIVKGGDSQQIAWNQALSIVDVRIDFGSIFNSMVAMTNGKTGDRPTIKKYIDSLVVGNTSVKGEDRYPEAHYSPDFYASFETFEDKAEAELKDLETTFGPRNKRQSPVQEERGLFERVTEDYKEVATNLRDSINTNTGFNI